MYGMIDRDNTHIGTEEGTSSFISGSNLGNSMIQSEVMR
jgi:hypothetical protein